MKKVRIILAVLLAAIMCTAILTACDPEPEYKYALNKTSATMTVGDTLQLNVVVTPQKETSATWSTSDAEKATVSTQGLVTAVAAGTVTITAKAEGKELTCAITINEPAVTYTYTLNKTSATLKTGETLQLEVTAVPEKEVEPEYTSSAIAVASVSSSGLVTANSEGTATITVTVNGEELQCVITVPVEYDYALNKTSMEFTYGEQAEKLTVAVTPEKAVTPSFASSATAVATVDQEGNVTPVAPGTAVITVTVDEETLTCEVTVNYSYAISDTSISLKKGATETLAVTIAPEKTDAVISYVSQYPEVATVNSAGLITAVAVGETTITVTADGKTYTCTVEVIPNAAATVTSEEITENVTVNLSANDVLYWEHYGWCQDGKNFLNQKLNAPDLITNNTIETCDWAFNDYKGLMNWTNGSMHNSWENCTDGRCSETDITFNVILSAGRNEIRVYTGAWNGTNTTSISLDGKVLAAAESFTAGNSSINTVVTFIVTAEEACTAEIKIGASDVPGGRGGNVTLVAVAFIGEVPPATTTVTMTKTEMTGVNDNNINLTEKGTKDWYYFGQPHGPTADIKNDQKADADFIKPLSLTATSGKGAWDYKARFTWTDGTNFQTVPRDDDMPKETVNDEEVPTEGTNNFLCGEFVHINVAVDSTVSNIYLYASCYDATYYVKVTDSNGNTIFSELIAEKVAGGTKAYELNFAVTATQAEELTFAIYGINSDNAGFAAIAVA